MEVRDKHPNPLRKRPAVSESPFTSVAHRDGPTHSLPLHPRLGGPTGRGVVLSRGLLQRASWLSASTQLSCATLASSAFTPVRIHASNGVYEAFVKTFKRDYGHVKPRPDAISVHPHWGLRMRSPRESIAMHSANPATFPV